MISNIIKSQTSWSKKRHLRLPKLCFRFSKKKVFAYNLGSPSSPPRALRMAHISSAFVPMFKIPFLAAWSESSSGIFGGEEMGYGKPRVKTPGCQPWSSQGKDEVRGWGRSVTI